MSDKRILFKVSFLKRAAELGFTLEETEQIVESLTKQGEGIADWIPFYDVIKPTAQKILDKTVDIGGDIASKALWLGAGTAAMAPLAIGSLTGLGAAKAQGLSGDVDTKEEKQREVIDAYHNALASIESSRRAQNIRKRQHSVPGFRAI